MAGTKPNRAAVVCSFGTALIVLLAMSRSSFAQLAGEGLPPPGLPAAADLLNPLAVPVPPPPGMNQQFPKTYQHGPEQPVPTESGWTFLPSISVQEMFNDNILQSQSDRRYDFITGITPGIQILGNTTRTNLSLTYAPTLNLYARTPSQDYVGQQLFAVGTTTLIEDTLYVNANALAALVPTNGGFGGYGFSQPLLATPGPSVGTQALGRQNLTQTYSASVTPYLVHRFGDTGTGKVGITLNETITSGSQGTAPIPGLATVANQNATTADVTAQFQTGPDFGRVRNFVLLDASRSDGTGVLQDAHQATASNWFGYAVNRQITPFVELGVEDIHYGGVPTTQITDATWQLGTVLTPNADSQLSIGYGHQQGANSLTVNGYYAFTPRSRLSVSYVTGLATDLQQIQQQLALANTDQTGAPVNAVTQAPLFFGSSLLGIQNTLYRNKTLTMTETTLLDRDTITLSVNYQVQSPVAFVTPQANISQTGIIGTAGWSHLLTELATLTMDVSYSTRTFGSALGSEQFLAAGASLSYTFTETLTGVVSYAFFDRRSSLAGQTMYENVVLLGLTKKF